MDADVVTLLQFARFLKRHKGLDNALTAVARGIAPDAAPSPALAPMAALARLRLLLRPMDFGPDLIKHDNAYLEGTRGWVFDKLKAWAALPAGDDNHRAFWVAGKAGLGKSVIAAQMVKRFGEEEEEEGGEAAAAAAAAPGPRPRRDCRALLLQA